jgi:hypothetical protein
MEPVGWKSKCHVSNVIDLSNEMKNHPLKESNQLRSITIRTTIHYLENNFGPLYMQRQSGSSFKISYHSIRSTNVMYFFGPPPLHHTWTIFNVPKHKGHGSLWLRAGISFSATPWLVRYLIWLMNHANGATLHIPLNSCGNFYCFSIVVN